MDNPFGKEPVEEVRLTDAPLEMVLCQIRYPELTAFAADEEGARRCVLQEFAKDFPSGAPESVPDANGARVATADGHTRLDITNSFLTLQTSEYTTRAEFLSLFRDVLERFSNRFQVPRATRLGYRYVNRVSDDGIRSQLPGLVRAEVLGAAAPVTDEPVELQLNVSEAQYRLAGGDQLKVKWGILPVGVTFDPSVRPVDSVSWNLDIDSSHHYSDELAAEFSLDDIALDADRISMQGYKIFRWAVTTEFLERFK